MTRVEKADWGFIFPATAIWVLSLALTTWDFVQLQGGRYSLNFMSVFGIALFVVGVSLRFLSRLTLKKNYSYILSALRKKELVTHGVYKFIRHPIYLAGILYTVGIPLVFSSLYGFAVALCFIPCVLYRVLIEERLLIQEFGDVYLEYKKRTKKLVPFIY